MRKDGLSPRMRGNPVVELTGDHLAGSIPAHAGEPSPATVYGSMRGNRHVDPHVGRVTCTSGLSPRMRGNRIPGLTPRMRGNRGRQCFVWIALGSVPDLLTGLSPRMRGNLIGDVGSAGELGSIPAHAGEPPGRPCRACGIRVYPRACGGTSAGCSAVHQEPGLSPRMRGNHAHGDEQARVHGSIPAHAGEPCSHNGC